jgi:hypothetical protein
MKFDFRREIQHTIFIKGLWLTYNRYPNSLHGSGLRRYCSEQFSAVE